MKKILFGSAAAFGALIVGFFVLMVATNDFGTEGRYYYLDLVNSLPTPATVAVSLTDKSWTIGPGELKTIKVEKQNDKNSKTPRTFTIETAGKQFQVEGVVGYSGHNVLDLAGTSCIVAADFGRQYGKREIPAGESDIVVKKVYRQQRFFQPETLDVERARFDFVVKFGVSEPLPKSISRSKGASGSAEVVKLVRVPCEVLQNGRALYQALVQSATTVS